MIWLIGPGYMGKEYYKVLSRLEKNTLVIGRGEKSALAFKEELGKEVVYGGLTKAIKESKEVPECAIVASNVETLASSVIELLEFGVKKILVEKPGGLNVKELEKVAESTRKYNASVYLAYNRRFYTSVKKAQEIIREDNGVTSFNFEFTEWSHAIEGLSKSKETFDSWLLANSSHVIDMAFFLGGFPKNMTAFSKGENLISWHKKASIFSGAGVTKNGALFNYCANWNSPGRWSVEIITKLHRLIFRPMEALQVQKIGSVAIDPVEIDNSIDLSFKPGLYQQTKDFLDGNLESFVTIEQQLENSRIYEVVLNGGTYEG